MRGKFKFFLARKVGLLHVFYAEKATYEISLHNNNAKSVSSRYIAFERNSLLTNE